MRLMLVSLQAGPIEGMRCVAANARLTAAVGAVLLVLLAAEGATIPIVRQALTVHIFLGLLLIPPVALKLASTGWRFFRYYRRDEEYVEAGPPHSLLRFVVAPVVVVSTVTLFGTGILLVVQHPHGGPVLGLHKASFIVWFGAMSIHVLAHVRTVWSHVASRMRVPGSALRAALMAATLAAGVAFAFFELPAAHSWAHWETMRHAFDRR